MEKGTSLTSERGVSAMPSFVGKDQFHGLDYFHLLLLLLRFITEMTAAKPHNYVNCMAKQRLSVWSSALTTGTCNNGG